MVETLQGPIYVKRYVEMAEGTIEIHGIATMGI